MFSARVPARPRRPSSPSASSAPFDPVLSTIPYSHDIEPYLTLTAHDCALHFVGLFMPTEVAFMPLLSQRRTIAGSLIGGVAQTQDILDVCAEHGIRPGIQPVAMEEINDAFEKAMDEDVRFRYVIDMSTLSDRRARIEPDAREFDAPVRSEPVN